jgi:hypothetical protein
MLNLFKKDSKMDPAELDKLRQKLAAVTSQQSPSATVQQQPAQAAPAAEQPTLQSPAIPVQPAPPQFAYVDPERAEDNERITNLIMQQIRELIEIDNNLNTKIKEMESKLVDNTNGVNNMKSMIETYSAKMEVIDKNMEKFMGLYEIVTNRFNPFIVEEGDEQEVPAPPEPEKDSPVKEIAVGKLPEPVQKPAEVIVQQETNQPKSPEASVPNDRMNDYVTQMAQAVNQQIKEAMIGLNASIDRQIKSTVKQQIESQYVRDLVKSTIESELTQPAAPKEEPKRTRKIPAQFQFHLSNGFFIDSIQSFIDGLRTLDDNAFGQYVDQKKNDFAQWIALALKDETMAAQAAKLKSRMELIEFAEKNL